MFEQTKQQARAVAVAALTDRTTMFAIGDSPTSPSVTHLAMCQHGAPAASGAGCSALRSRAVRM